MEDLGEGKVREMEFNLKVVMIREFNLKAMVDFWEVKVRSSLI
jgi:hypothetical protein